MSPIERERGVVTGLLVLLVLLWLGFTVHRSPQFPGSLTGTLLAIAGAALMVAPSLTYTLVKRIPGLRQRVASRLPLRRLLTWHVWGGIVGAVLAILHTGHRFESTLGTGLVSIVLLVIFSGYVGRHFLAKVSLELREKQTLLESLMSAYNGLAGEMATRPLHPAAQPSQWWHLRGLGRGFRPASDPETYALAQRANELTTAIAELEYGIKTDDLMKRRFQIWLVVHIISSVLFYGLLTLHIWASLYFGFRWLA